LWTEFFILALEILSPKTSFTQKILPRQQVSQNLAVCSTARVILQLSSEVYRHSRTRYFVMRENYYEAAHESSERCIQNSTKITTALIEFALWVYLLQGIQRLGSLGNMEALRTLSRPRYRKTTLSSPMPAPPWGDTPWAKHWM
jgi:hypothetical protein